LARGRVLPSEPGALRGSVSRAAIRASGSSSLGLIPAALRRPRTPCRVRAPAWRTRCSSGRWNCWHRERRGNDGAPHRSGRHARPAVPTLFASAGFHVLAQQALVIAGGCGAGQQVGGPGDVGARNLASEVFFRERPAVDDECARHDPGSAGARPPPPAPESCRRRAIGGIVVHALPQVIEQDADATRIFGSTTSRWTRAQSKSAMAAGRPR